MLGKADATPMIAVKDLEDTAGMRTTYGSPLHRDHVPEADTLMVARLRSAGAICGEGAEQVILRDCAPDRFCKLPGGEMCIFGLPEAQRMTQITPAEWQAVLPTLRDTGGWSGFGVDGDIVLGGAACLLAGLALGLSLGLTRRSRRP